MYLQPNIILNVRRLHHGHHHIHQIIFLALVSRKQANNKHARRGCTAEQETQQNKTSEGDMALHHEMKCATVNNEWIAVEDANFQWFLFTN